MNFWPRTPLCRLGTHYRRKCREQKAKKKHHTRNVPISCLHFLPPYLRSLLSL
jgi:hypothetical protein